MTKFPFWVACFWLLASCGAAQEQAPETVDPTPREAVTVDEGEQAPPVTNPELAATLEELCRVATEEMADRSRPVIQRLDRTEDRFHGTEHRDRLDTFFDRVEGRAHQGEVFFEAIAAQAEAEGVPGYRCEPLARALVLREAGDDDVDPSLVASPEQDFQRMCSIATEVLSEASQNNVSPEVVASLVASQWERELTNPLVLNTFHALGMVEPSARYRTLQIAAEEVGLPGWSCSVIERFWGP